MNFFLMVLVKLNFNNLLMMHLSFLSLILLQQKNKFAQLNLSICFKKNKIFTLLAKYIIASISKN